MTRVTFEALLFLSLAVAVHVALWLRMPDGALDASGAGGETAISLAAETPEIAELVENFDTPPDIVDDVLPPEMIAPALTPPPAPVVEPPIPTSVAKPAMVEMPQLEIAGIALPDMQPPPEAPKPPAEIEEPELALDAPPDLATTLEVPDAPAPEPPSEIPDRPELSALEPPSSLDLALPEPPPEIVEPKPLPEEPTIASPRPPRRPDAPPPTQSRPQQPPPPARAETPQDAPTGQQTRTGQAEQRAAGSGGGQAAGNSGRSEVASLSPARRQNMLATWGSQIRARIERRKAHPRGARENGTATVRLVVATDGRLVSLSLARSSGVAAYDEAALNAVRRAGRFRKAPKQLGAGQHTFTLPIQFRP